jgi:tRNA (guanine37-N1)-methyltransferase
MQTNRFERKIFVVLLHYPVIDRNGKEVVTSVTNLDIHDIARSCRTYGVERFFIVNPENEQARLVKEILDHWKKEINKIYHPARGKALALVEYAFSFEEVLNEVVRISSLAGVQVPKPYVVMPDARNLPNSISYAELRRRIFENQVSKEDNGYQPIVIVYGTGWGISPSFFKNVDQILAPIRSTPNPINDASQYNHLSVRAAAAIVLDRLLGQ